jgi:choline monooxygenase
MTTSTAVGSPTFLLPPDAYRDADWFERERQHVFTRSWALVGDAARLTDPGDWLTAVVGGVPIVAVVDADGVRRAFHNVCRHRGMVMVDGCGSDCRTIRCGYHDWRYGLDGSLLTVPQRAEQFPEIEAGALALRRAAIDVWEGMVFVSPDVAVGPLAGALEGIPAALGSHRPGCLPVVASADVVARCNWKLLVENHIDVYHLWYLHRESLGDFDHPRFEYELVGRNWVSYEPLRSGDNLRRLDAGGVPIRHLDERDRDGIGAHLAFPSILFASTAEFFMSYAVVPLAPDRSRLELRVRAEPDCDAGA